MQLARLRFHLQTRTPTGKLVQIVRALELERHYSKSEILEAYLNLAPYGRNIEGVGAASQIYFGKTAERLTGPESISLSVIPQSPTRRALYADTGNPSLNAAQENWYDRTKVDLQFSARQFSARAETEREFLAPHFVQQVLATEKGRDGVVTTLDLQKQQLIERRIADYIRGNRNRGIQNAAALLVDVRTMDVLAQIGSADFFNSQIHGQVDGTRSSRSPGSAFKPFIYALALDQGLIHPLSILAAAPRSFGDYNPENFDREFLVPIRASDALARSRNLPAVELASQLAHPTLYEFLRGAGVALPRSESLYGLALPLGGAEIKMEDLVRLYAALANNGELRSLRRKLSDPNSVRGRQVITPEAAFLTLEMLNVPRPEINFADSSNVAPVFWKTGTSHGFHDAWSIAVFNHYVLAVWIGNFDGKPNPAFVGRAAAAPLLFQIIDSLRASWPDRIEPHLPPPGANLKRVEFCAVSGDLPEIHCTHRVEGWFIPGISPIKTCDVHQEVLVDVAIGLRVPIDDGTRLCADGDNCDGHRPPLQVKCVPSIHAASSGKIDIDPYRLPGGVERTATCRRDCRARAAADYRRRRFRKNPYADVSRRLSARERDRSTKHFAAHVHQQSRATNARPRRESVANRCERNLGRNISFRRKPDAAPAWEHARIQQRVHDHGPRGPEGFDQHRRRERGNRSKGDPVPERRRAGGDFQLRREH